MTRTAEIATARTRAVEARMHLDALLTEANHDPIVQSVAQPLLDGLPKLMIDADGFANTPGQEQLAIEAFTALGNFLIFACEYTVKFLSLGPKGIA